MADENEDLQAYGELMSQWFDELAPLVDRFKDNFPSDNVGMLRYLFALHMMTSALCMDMKIDENQLPHFTRTITAWWYASGKPAAFSIIKGRAVADPPAGKPN